MKTITLTAAWLLLLAAQVQAAPTLNLYSYPARQLSNSQISVGLIVSAGSIWHQVTAGGGWTVTCPFTTGQVNAERVVSSGWQQYGAPQ